MLFFFMFAILTPASTFPSARCAARRMNPTGLTPPSLPLIRCLLSAQARQGLVTEDLAHLMMSRKYQFIFEVRCVASAFALRQCHVGFPRPARGLVAGHAY